MRTILAVFRNLGVPVLLVVCLLGVARAQVNITTYKNDNAHTGQNLVETVLSPSVLEASGGFGLIFNQTLDGQVYAQPLFMSGVTIPSKGIHNVVFIATQHDSVYAFDADSNTGANTLPLWHTSFLDAPSNPPSGVNFTSDGASTIPTKNANTSDITVEIGITTTPVIDPTSNTLYVVSKTMTVSGSTTTYFQYLHALDITTGQDKIPKQLINPSFSGNGNGSVGGQIAFDALREHLRSSMLLYDGLVYLSYASHSDQGNYHGLILGYNATTLQLVKSFITTPNGSEGGIWAAGCGPAVDGTGNLFVTTGNGSFDQKTAGGFDWSECFLKLPTTGAFTIADYSTDFFAPNNQAALTSGDVDLGSSGVLLLPDQSGPHPHIMISGGKGDVMYVVDRDILGGNVASGQSDQVVQKVTEPHRLFCTPSYFNGYVYYAPEGGNMLCRQVGYSSATGDYLASTPIQSKETFSAHGSSAFISANGTSNGIVWIINAATPSILYAYDAAKFSTSTGSVGSIYQFPLVYGTGSNVINDSANKFTLPTVANGKVYLTAYDPPANGATTTVAHLFVLGTLTAATTAPTAPSQLTAAPSSSTQITLSWKDNSGNESGFKILRASQAGGPFSQVGLTGANITTFTDGSLAPETDYFYEIVATNNVGDSAPTNVADGTTFQPFTPPGLLSYWNFDEGSGTNVRDVSGHGYNGVLNGEVGFIPGFIGNAALNFHGTGNAVANVTVTDAPSLRFTASQSFTLSAWIQPAGTRTTDEGIICKSRDIGNYYGIWISTSGNHWVFRGPQGDLVGPVATTNWTHVAAVQDGVADKRYLYINGVLAASGPAQAGDGTGDLWFGQAKSVTEPFPGDLDEIRLYGRALAATEIGSLMGPPILQASSRLTQGTSGTFDLVLPMDGTVLTEPRQGVPAGSYNLVLKFSSPVSGLNALLGLQAGVSGTSVGTVNAVAYDSTGTIVTVSLGGVGSGQALNLHLSGIEPGNGTADVPLNVLVGDVNGDGAITQADGNLIQSHVGQPDTEANFSYDLDGNGEVDAADVAIVNAVLNASESPMPFRSWEAQYFNSTQLADPTISGLTATPEGDSVPNLLKYIANINPSRSMTAADRAALPIVTFANAHTTMILTYHVNKQLTGITFTPQKSTDLATWSTAGTATQIGSDANTTIWQLQISASGTQFFRLRVTSP